MTIIKSLGKVLYNINNPFTTPTKNYPQPPDLTGDNEHLSNYTLEHFIDILMIKYEDFHFI